MQNDTGFLIVSGDTPPDDLFIEVEKEISSTESSSPRRCGDKCRELMRYGLRLPDEDWFQKYLGCSYYKAKKIGDTRLMLFDKNRLGRFVPGPPGTVLIYRAATRDGLSSGNGFFEIVPRSHRMTAGEIKRAKSIPVNLGPGDVLFLAANMTIEYIKSGGGVALCEAVSASLESGKDENTNNA